MLGKELHRPDLQFDGAKSGDGVGQILLGVDEFLERLTLLGGIPVGYCRPSVARRFAGLILQPLDMDVPVFAAQLNELKRFQHLLASVGENRMHVLGKHATMRL